MAPLFMVACANIQPLNGGEKDIEPPELQSLNPENYSTNFGANKVVWEFDEFLSLKEVKKNLIVNPLTSQEFPLQVKGKTLIMDIPDSLDDEATYSVSFGSAIADFNEGNATDSLEYVFTYGEKIDTGFIEGLCLGAFEEKLPENLRVGLFKLLDSSLASEADYVARLDASGGFSFRFVEPGDFWLIAFKDEDFDRTPDLESAVALHPEKLNSYDITDSIPVIYISKPEPLKLNTEDYTIKSKEKIEILFSRYPRPEDSLKYWLEGTGVNDYFQLTESAYGDTLNVWGNPKYESDSLSLIIKTVFGTDSILLDFSTLKIPEEPQKTENIKLDARLINRTSIVGEKPLIIKAKEPITTIDTAAFRLFADTLQVPSNWSVVKDKESPFQLKVNYQFESGIRYTLEVDSNAVQSFSGKVNDKRKIRFSLIDKEQLCLLELNMSDTSTCPVIVQLITEKGKLVQELSGMTPTKHLFENIQPGKYRIRAILDCNKNGRWDPFRIDNLRQPERVEFYPTTIELEAGWEIRDQLFQPFQP